MPLRERWGIHTAASCHKGLVCSFRSIRSKPDPKVCGPDDVQLNILGLRTAKELAKRFAGELQDKITTCYAPMWLVCYRGSVITVCQSYKCMQHKRLHLYCQCPRYTSPAVSIRHQIYKENTLSVPEVLCCKPQWISSKSSFFSDFQPPNYQSSATAIKLGLHVNFRGFLGSCHASFLEISPGSFWNWM